MDAKRVTGILGKDLLEAIKLVTTYYSHSKLFDYSNFTTIEGQEGSIKLSQCLILGEALNTGMMSVTVPCQSEIFQVSIPTDQLVAAAKTMKGVDMDMEIHANKLVIRGGGRLNTLPLAGIHIPRDIKNGMIASSQRALEDFDMKTLKDIYATLAKELNNTTIDFALHGIYIDNEGSYATNGLKMICYDVGMESDKPMYLPALLDKIIKAIPEGPVHIARRFDDLAEVEHLYFKGLTWEMSVQEWVKKDLYPIQIIKHTKDNLPGREVEDYAHLVETLQDIATIANIVVLNFNTGVATEPKGRISATIPVQDLPVTRIHTTLLPKKSEYKNYTGVEVVSNAQGHSAMVKFVGTPVTKIIANVIEGAEEWA